jgi:hypothetical protein
MLSILYRLKYFHRTNSEAGERDTGFIPGDNLGMESGSFWSQLNLNLLRSLYNVGSAGLDSSMFSHLKRNWSVQSTNKDKAEIAAKPKIDSLIPRKRPNSKSSITFIFLHFLKIFGLMNYRGQNCNSRAKCKKTKRKIFPKAHHERFQRT